MSDRPPNAIEPTQGLAVYQVWEFMPDGSAKPITVGDDDRDGWIKPSTGQPRYFPLLLEADAACNDLAEAALEGAERDDDGELVDAKALPRYKVVEVQP